VHDRELLKFLAERPQEEFSEPVWRARPASDRYSPTTPVNIEGRWATSDGPAVLYTSLERDGSLAEIAFHWSQLTPLMRRPAALYQLRLKTSKTLRLLRTDLEILKIPWHDYETTNYRRTAVIGDAVAWLGCDGLIAPNARWDCENLMVFPDNLPMSDEYDIEIVKREEVDGLPGRGIMDSWGLSDPTARKPRFRI
jgi:RES domain